MKVLVTGGRSYANKDHLFTTLDRVHAFEPITAIVHGCAGFYDREKEVVVYGADEFAGEWARKNGIKEFRYPANWNKYGKGAGFMRNIQMLDYEAPRLVVAFPGGNGTKHMVDNAILHGVDVLDSSTLKVTPGKKQKIIDIGDFM